MNTETMNPDKQQRGRGVKFEVVQRQFERWRRKRKPRSRIPAPLWSAATTLAGTHGIHRTAKALRLDYYALKKRVEQQAASDGEATENSSDGESVGRTPLTENSSVPFWELTPAAELGASSGDAASAAGQGECTLELADANGNKLRVHLRGLVTPDLAALSRSFWNPAT